MHRIKARITSFHVTKSLTEEKNDLSVQITIAAIGDYSVIEVEDNPEKRTVWNSFVEKVSEKTLKNTRRAILYPVTEAISVDPSLHSLVQEIYFQQHAVVFEVNIKTSSQPYSISIQKIIAGGK